MDIGLLISTNSRYQLVDPSGHRARAENAAYVPLAIVLMAITKRRGRPGSIADSKLLRNFQLTNGMRLICFRFCGAFALVCCACFEVVACAFTLRPLIIRVNSQN